MGRVPLRSLILACSVACALSFASPAAAWNDGGTTDPSITDCMFCHEDRGDPDNSRYEAGPHGGYTATTGNCQACHFVHDAPGAIKLLWRDTITDTCFTCHDGSGGKGVYGTIVARGFTVGSGHSVDTTDVVPGGSADTGGDATYTFRGENGCMSCSDCHTPHHAQVVNEFWGDRDRGSMDVWTESDKLLKAKPNGVETAIAEYGSDWCAACHAGRASGLSEVHNHPVDSTTTHGTPFYYDRVARVKSAVSLETTISYMARSNWGYLMPTPRTADQAGHDPICQQCHEDSRDVGEPGAGVDYVKDEDDGFDNVAPVDNPRFEGFPHETVNSNMLVEPNDDLCLNCHTAAQLP